MKEKNRLATENVERQRLEPGYGQYEADMRLKAVSVGIVNGAWHWSLILNCVGSNDNALDQGGFTRKVIRAN
jgi:hypothetical protein